jgi:hypothetical protein
MSQSQWAVMACVPSLSWASIHLASREPRHCILRECFLSSVPAQPKGETDGNATTIATKNKVGCPPKLTTSNNDELGIQGGTHKHIYQMVRAYRCGALVYPEGVWPKQEILNIQ